MTAIRTSQHDHLTTAFAPMAERWSRVGVWCTVWRRSGQLISSLPEGSRFWKYLWNNSQAVRNTLAQHARTSSGQLACEALLEIPGIRGHCIPLNQADADDTVAIVCLLSDACSWGEEFTRLCSQCNLDEAVMRTLAAEAVRMTDEQATHLLSIIGAELTHLFHGTQQQNEIEAMTSQLGDAYEELNLIYRVGAHMRITQQPRDHFRQLFEDLARTTPITTMAAVIFDDEIIDPLNRLIIGGEPIVDDAGILRIVECLRSDMSATSNALIINDLKDHPQLDWANSWLQRLIMVPIVRNKMQLGMLLVLNQRGDLDFDSTDVRLLHSVVDRSAIYLENVLLYGDLNKLLMGLMHALVSSIDAKDPYTCGHSNRVALICKRIAEQCGCTPQQSERLYLSGLLHDIGKIGISELILCKPGRLDENEMSEMQKHPEIGAKILSGISQLDDIIPGVLYHHEWVNGAGYPKKLSADEIPWIARVVGIADAFDAMTSGRNYRDALPLQSAMAEIRRFAGIQFDPELVDVLITLVRSGLDDELKHIERTPAFENVYTKWVTHEIWP